jgi:multiple antibiotic resistance protein
MLKVLGISISSFQVGGGILLLLTAIAMLQARQVTSKHTPEEDQENREKESVGVVPLAIPLLAGPGAISTVIIYAHNGTLVTKLALCIITMVIVVITWLTLHAAIRLSHMMSKTALNIAIRLMGLLLASIAIEFITNGLGLLLPGLKP